MTVAELYEHQKATGKLWPYTVQDCDRFLVSIQDTRDGHFDLHYECMILPTLITMPPDTPITVHVAPEYDELVRLRAENARLRSELAAIATLFSDAGLQKTAETARAALAESGERESEEA